MAEADTQLVPVDAQAKPHVEDYLDRIRPSSASNLLLWGILAFLAIFLVWAAFARLDRTVIGTGRVIPSAQLQTVSNLEGGVVEAILVRTGAVVRAGAPLVRLSPIQTSAEFGGGQSTVDALTAKIARLEAEVAGREPVYPAAANPGVADQIRIEQALHASRLSDLRAAQNALSANVSEASRAVNEAQANFAARAAARESARMQADMLRPLVERGIEPRMSLVQAESQAAVTSSEAASARASIARARAAVAEASAQLAQQRQDWRAQAAAELATAQAELGARRSALPALADRVARTVVRAPLSGRINRVLVATVGGTVRPGEPIVEIVPSDESLLIETRVLPKDIASVRIGQKAKVDVTAYDPAVYGSLDGNVVTISPDAVVDERTGESFYTVRVRTASNALADRDGRKLPIGVGMVANASLLGDKRSVLQYLLTPITRLSERALRE